MSLIENKHTFRFDIKSIDLLRFSSNRTYTNIISPYSRIYLIKSGHGCININGQEYILEPGYLYLIPSFQACTYFFSDNLEHYYVHFRIQMLSGLNAYTLFKTSYKVSALKLDYALFERLLSINPNIAIPHHDPGIYQTRAWMLPKVSYKDISHYNENRGILDQLFSRFLLSDNMWSGSKSIRYNMRSVLEYIQANIKESIKVDDLAEIACLSKDHFTRVFKHITSYTPCEYMIRQRIEQAQFLLLSSDYSIGKIVEETGFKSPAYFSRMFKKRMQLTPLEFRNSRGNT